MADEDVKIIAIIGGVFAFICWLIYFGFHQKSYTLEVKQIQWEWNVHIEQYQVEHHDGARSKSSFKQARIGDPTEVSIAG